MDFKTFFWTSIIPTVAESMTPLLQRLPVADLFRSGADSFSQNPPSETGQRAKVALKALIGGAPAKAGGPRGAQRRAVQDGAQARLAWAARECLSEGNLWMKAGRFEEAAASFMMAHRLFSRTGQTERANAAMARYRSADRRLKPPKKDPFAWVTKRVEEDIQSEGPIEDIKRHTLRAFLFRRWMLDFQAQGNERGFRWAAERSCLSFRRSGEIFLEKDYFAWAEKSFHAAMHYALLAGDGDAWAKCYLLQASSLRGQKLFLDALTAYGEVLAYLEKTGNAELIVQVLEWMGDTHDLIAAFQSGRGSFADAANAFFNAAETYGRAMERLWALSVLDAMQAKGKEEKAGVLFQKAAQALSLAAACFGKIGDEQQKNRLKENFLSRFHPAAQY